MPPEDQPAKKKKKFVPPSPEELAPLFPQYAIEDFIAAGGMGAVYKAKQISLDRAVAIKILPREFGADAQFRESFEDEAKAMAKLNHPNLMAVYDFGDVDGMLYIVMEFIRGKALYYSAHRKQIDPETAFNLILQIAEGLSHAHDNGILHRDIKPANILLLPDTTPKIGDFGLARTVDSRGHRERQTFGTPGYTAPEVYSKKYPVDQRSDIFSLGAMLCELLSGEVPKPNSSYMVTGMDPRFDAITRKATHPVPEQRHKDTKEFIREIKEVIPTLSKSGRLKTTLVQTGQITTRVAAHITGPVVTSGRITAPVITSPHITSPHITAPVVTSNLTKSHPIPDFSQKKKKKGASTALLALVGLVAVGAVIYLVTMGKKPPAPIATGNQAAPAEPAPTQQPKPAKSSPDAAALAAQARAVLPDGRTVTQTFTDLVKDARRQVQSDHYRGYARYQRRKRSIVKNFASGCADLLQGSDAPRVRAMLNDAMTQLVLPSTLPSSAPDTAKQLLQNAHSARDKEWRSYRLSFQKARLDYQNTLRQSASSFSKQPLIQNGVIREIEAVKKDDHLHLILQGKAPAIPSLAQR